MHKIRPFKIFLLLYDNIWIITIPGEFGVVYKGHIIKNLGQITTEVVAVKTLKGRISLLMQLCSYVLILIVIDRLLW